MKNSGQFKPAGQEPRRGKGGARTGAGRKSNQVKANEAEATRIARETLAACFGDLLELAMKLCRGVKRRRHHPKTGAIYYETEYDSAMIRFLIERFIPAARQAMDVAVGTPEEFYRAIQASRQKDK